MLRPAMMAINELKFPMLMHSFPTSKKYSITFTLFFFFVPFYLVFLIFNKIVSARLKLISDFILESQNLLTTNPLKPKTIRNSTN
jgi:hypothetical protein